MTPEQREAHNARRRKRIAEHPERREEHNARKREYNTKWRNEHREEYRAYHRKWMNEHREEYNARNRKHRAKHRIYMKNRNVEQREKYRKYRAEDVNKFGIRKNSIRKESRHILTKNHAKIKDYEIHHCFGYEDPNRFIYIPKKLHKQIHKFLRYNNIPADSVHWDIIRDLVNRCKEYTYIRC